jgi:hypothetical protein
MFMSAGKIVGNRTNAAEEAGQHCEDVTAKPLGP